MMSPSLIRDITSSYDWIESFSVDSALHAVLSHNDEPTSLQAASAASSKESIDLARHHITQDIDNLQNALLSLRARRRVLNDLSAQHAGVLSSFRRLPNEILLEIFLHACGPHFRIGRVEEGPWKLRAVCRKWTNIVEGCSQLWCNMVIDLADELRPNVFMEVLRFCASRHIHMTLDLSRLNFYRSRRLSDCQWPFTALRVFKIITPSSPRWESLAIVNDGDVLQAVLELFPRLERKLPVLRSLTLRGGMFAAAHKSLSALLTAPLLETVHFDFTSSEDFETFLDLVPLPFQQIRQLSCHCGHRHYSPELWKNHFLLSKEKFPLLERAAFVNKRPLTFGALASDRVEHDGVTHLAAAQTELLDAFSFPSLRILSIGDSDKDFVRATTEEEEEEPTEGEKSGMIVNSVSNMLLASRCSLVSLVFSDLMLVDEFLHVLHIVSTLEVLDMRVLWWKGVERDGILCRFFNALGSRPNPSKTFSFLPALRDLRLSIVASCALSDYDAEYEAYVLSFNYDEPIQPRNFSFVPRVVEAITERSKYPSDLRVFSLKMLMNDSTTWGLSNEEISRLRDLELTKFYYDGLSRLTEPEEGREGSIENRSDDSQDYLEGQDDIVDCI